MLLVSYLLRWYECVGWLDWARISLCVFVQENDLLYQIECYFFFSFFFFFFDLQIPNTILRRLYKHATNSELNEEIYSCACSLSCFSICLHCNGIVCFGPFGCLQNGFPLSPFGEVRYAHLPLYVCTSGWVTELVACISVCACVCVSFFFFLSIYLWRAFVRSNSFLEMNMRDAASQTVQTNLRFISFSPKRISVTLKHTCKHYLFAYRTTLLCCLPCLLPYFKRQAPERSTFISFWFYYMFAFVSISCL